MTAKTIRAIIAADLEHLRRLNNDAVPAVNALDPPALADLVRMAHSARVVEHQGRAAGFLLALGPGTGYDSLNYRWFEQRYDGFLYIDRVVIDPAIRGAGLGTALYQDLIRQAQASGVPRLTCEVNLRPPNPRSMRFHLGLGFAPVGTQDTEGARKRVQLLSRSLLS
ncbi:MAG: GNAT family N-acetyltransferase [Alphaproteobacteria bacterium]|nr:GNAT family N-acetyltransferase [Alphaproteobacteria bacterium]